MNSFPYIFSHFGNRFPDSQLQVDVFVLIKFTCEHMTMMPLKHVVHLKFKRLFVTSHQEDSKLFKIYIL